MSANDDSAALAAQQEDESLTEAAQIAPGNTAKLTEFLAGESTSPALLAAFEAAANSAHYTQNIETFNQQQQEQSVLQEQAREKKEGDEREDSWLDAMSPEYRQAYGQLMTTVDNADREYDQLRQRLQQRGEDLDEEAQKIDDKAIHLSDGSRAYVNDKGELVDQNGVPLKGAAAAEAEVLFQETNGDVASFELYQENEQSRAQNERLLQRVDAEENDANKIKQDAEDKKIPDTSTLQTDTTEIKKRLKATHTAVDATIDNDSKVAAGGTKASFSDLDDDAPAPNSPANHGSYANAIDPAAGISTTSLSNPFNAVTKPAAAPAAPAVPKTPSVGAPSPANP
jgi:hypothetical protein